MILLAVRDMVLLVNKLASLATNLLALQVQDPDTIPTLQVPIPQAELEETGIDCTKIHPLVTPPLEVCRLLVRRQRDWLDRVRRDWLGILVLRMRMDKGLLMQLATTDF
jgi:hypothetical protein